ncbi:TonB-dependent receptor [Arenimonas sp. GDDSR-1]|uniref:TonB-dependent receptor n=1 Tax=Arenimonas sp. GDDSR-1 TaxID=2950125 RepID=UPI00260C6CBC|nr:TonB-dependent receptor [Arenimonas sp. GDDSR-1]
MVLKRNMLSVALMSATMLLVGTANAQEATDAEKAAAKKAADAETIDKVTVKGIRRGIEDAIDTKQSATGIVESVSAEDIGKLPDSSIAESIARLPGLTAQRERGRATQINIRGFAGDFAGTTLNGREQVSLGDNRGVEFDQYPSELLSAVTVYKTPDASLVGQGLSGTVDLQTVKPLSFGERVVALNYRYDQKKVAGQTENGGRYSFSYIDQFMDNTLGVAIGFAHMDSPEPGFQNEAWGYADGPSSTKVFGGGKVYQFDNNFQRDGLMATVQFKPTEFYETSLDLFYSEFKKTEIKTGMEFGTAWGQGVLQPGYVVNGNGTITDSTWTNVKPVLRMDSNPINDELFSLGWNHKFKINDNWSVTADFSASNAKRHFDVLETYAGLKGAGTATVNVVLDESGQFNNYYFNTDFNDPNNLQLIDAGNWGQDGYLKAFEIHDELQSFRLDATRSFDEGFLSSVEFGYNFTDRHKEKSSDEYRLCLSATQCGNGSASAAFPGSPGDFNFSGIDGLATYDAVALLNSGIYRLDGKNHPDISKKNWEVDERVQTFFVQANIDTDLTDTVTLRGNVGFQYVSVDQSSAADMTIEGANAGIPISNGASYSDFLPSLNLSFGFPGDQVLRFAAARQMARPRMDDLRANQSIDIPDSGTCAGLPTPVWCGNAGNPELKPWLADAYDLSYEKYFTTENDNKGYVSAAYFYKDLKTYIYRKDMAWDYSGYPLPPPGPGQTVGVNYPSSTMGSMNMPINGEGGVLQGLELAVSVPLDVLWAPLNGFGIQAAYSDTKSKISPNGPGSSEPLPGLSKYVSNVTAYYENHGFSIRFSQRHRSAFRAETRGFGADLTYININAETVQDAQINYSFSEGTFKDLTLYLQMSNIGDEPFTTSDGGDPAARPVQYFEYGRTTLIGFSYKF